MKLFIDPDMNEERIKIALIIIFETLQTLIDLPFIILSGPLLVLAPYKAHLLIRDFKTRPGEEWRMMIVKHYYNWVIDLPFILMFIVICLSVFMALKLRR